jgi:hypothetical protein
MMRSARVFLTAGGRTGKATLKGRYPIVCRNRNRERMALKVVRCFVGGDFTGKGIAMAFSRSSFLILVSVPSGSKLPASLSHPAADRRTDSAPTVQYVPHL